MAAGLMHRHACFNATRLNLFTKYIYMTMKLCHSMSDSIVIGIL